MLIAGAMTAIQALCLDNGTLSANPAAHIRLRWVQADQSSPCRIRDSLFSARVAGPRQRHAGVPQPNKGCGPAIPAAHIRLGNKVVLSSFPCSRRPEQRRHCVLDPEEAVDLPTPFPQLPPPSRKLPSDPALWLPDAAACWRGSALQLNISDGVDGEIALLLVRKPISSACNNAGQQRLSDATGRCGCGIHARGLPI